MQTIRNSYPNDIIFVDGFAKSGKIILERVLEYFDTVENHSEIDILEALLEYHSLGMIKIECLQNLFKLILDRECYNLNISRCLNTRFRDDSSIFHNPKLLMYIRRLFKDRKIAEYNIYKGESTLNIAMHGAITNSKFLLDTFKNRAKIISIIRHPFDIVSGIESYGYYDRITNSPSNTTTLINHKNIIMPYFAVNWDTDYEKIDDIERTLRWYYESMKSDLEVYKSLNEDYRKNILIVDFDVLTTNPICICEKLSKFIRKPYSMRVLNKLRQMNCPREKPIRTTPILHKDLCEKCISVYNEMKGE